MSNKSVEKFLFFPSGAFYLGILGVLLGAGLFSSGLVTWIAANWDGFSHFTKLYGIQFIFVFCVLAGLFFFCSTTTRAGAPSRLSLMVFLGGSRHRRTFRFDRADLSDGG